ncbi:MAG: U32 family peptidase, partial [Oscillospiraceae bacterium]|nr:U32 family peptidase [Oscillospiraceae bacterium]
MNQFELLAPAGDRERFEAAVAYGADAIYLGGKEFGMRAAPSNFDNEQLKWAVDYAHERGVKVYLTCNTLPRNGEIDRIPEYFKFVNEIGVDALIIADIGVMSLAKEYAPDVELHVSTQFGITNYQTANQLYKMGASRVVLARELSLEEIKTIRANTPP